MKRLAISQLVTLVLALTGCSGTSPAHTASQLTDPTTGRPLQIDFMPAKWRVTGAPIDSLTAPFLYDNAIVGSLVNVGLEPHATIGIDLTTQQLRWKRDTTEVTEGRPTGNGSRVTVVEAEGKLIEFNGVDRFNVYGPGDHPLLFSVFLPKEFRKPSIGSGIEQVQRFRDTLVLNVARGVVAYHISDILAGPTEQPLIPVWTQLWPDVGGTRNYSGGLAVSEQHNTVVFGRHEVNQTEQWLRETMYAVDATTGEVRWQRELEKENFASSGSIVFDIEDDTIVALVSGQSSLHAFDFQGNERWKVNRALCPNGNTTLFYEVHIHKGQVYPVPNGDSCQNAYDAATGALKWTFYPPKENSYSFGNTPLFVNDVMYMNNSYLFAVDTRNGKILARSQDMIQGAESRGGSPLYDSAHDQILVWGHELKAFAPIR
ncbi:PQQ-binding-like beta-propeller repeat protein [Deinococcus aestuarii]|uniref:outer membrane protein assembly factor BamB family protein n=1 Tax=Deinococcus aestuarii TaxID=2774531 RepID=UPI001C0B149A|nr:PQQ-binding-like beta-propeller repeat protein [Deinococcus aestuarii]